jgi:hypothetical protein
MLFLGQAVRGGSGANHYHNHNMRTLTAVGKFYLLFIWHKM